MVVKVEHLIKKYDEVTALNNFNMTVQRGEILGLLGPNGSGKTTAINCLLSLLTYNNGNIEVFGKKMSPSAYDLKAKIGLVPQDIAVISSLTVEQNIDYFCGLYVSDKDKRKKLIDEAIEFVKLEKYRKFLFKKLSGGLKRRVNIACGIAHKPELLILDEPSVAVDAQSRNFILSGIEKLNQNGTSVLYTSHYLEEVEQICDRVIVMDKGENIAEGTKNELISLLPVGDIVEVEFVEDEIKYDEIMDRIKNLEDYLDMTRDKDVTRISFKNTVGVPEKFIAFLRENNLAYKNLNFSKPSLNEVFLYLTGKELRE